tara:strand:+ start:3412 stop:3651 length:240 start_codon:yes stop_codon:yes gene_type:complete
MNPQTIEEWNLYVSELTPEQLWSKAIAMNTIRYVRLLEEEGFQPDYIMGVFQVFARRFVNQGFEPPTGGYIDFREILDL